MKTHNSRARLPVTPLKAQAAEITSQKGSAAAGGPADVRTQQPLTTLARTAPRAASAPGGKTAQLTGQGLVAPGDARPDVKSPKLASALKAAFRASVRAFDYAGEKRSPDNAYPKILAGRAAVWSAVDRVIDAPVSKESKDLRAAVAELAEFRSVWGQSRDEANMPRIWGGYYNQHADGSATTKPGLKALLQNVFDAAKMGTVVPAPRNWS